MSSGWSRVTAKAPVAEFSTHFSCFLPSILSSISSISLSNSLVSLYYCENE
jgi:hypothetical protein